MLRIAPPWPLAVSGLDFLRSKHQRVGGRVSTPPSPLNLTYRDVALKIFDPTRDPGEPPRQEVFLTYDRHTRPTPRHG